MTKFMGFLPDRMTPACHHKKQTMVEGNRFIIIIDFCGKHNVTADVEIIPIQKVNEAFDRLSKADVKYRFSIDMASLKSK